MENQPSELQQKHCQACSDGGTPLAGEELDSYSNQIEDGWDVIDEHHLQRSFSFRDFRQALNFTNQVGELAESEGHHPDILLKYGEVCITLWTHTIDGLSEADFILAAKIDQL